MMKYYAPVAPIALLNTLLELAPFRKYCLILAHDVLEHPLEYRRLFKGRDRFIILDNSVVELGSAMPPQKIMDAAQIVDARVIVLPDVMGDMDGTLNAVVRFTDYLSRAELRAYDWMGVPHGKTPLEFVNSASEIQTALGGRVRYWGIPRLLANDDAIGSRRPFVEAMYDCFTIRKPNIHLLGMSRNFADDMLAVHMDGVMGIDSANPVVLGQLGKSIQDTQEHKPRKTPEWDYWQGTALSGIAVDNAVLVYQLVNRRVSLDLQHLISP